MLKKLLIASMALLAVGSAQSFERKVSKFESNRFSAFPGEIEQTNSFKTRADQTSINFSIADQVYSAYKLNDVNVGDIVYLAFEMSGDNATSFANDEITAVNITTGVYVVGQTYQNKVNDITIFISTDLQEEPVYTQDAYLGTRGFTEYPIALTTPYKIEAGKGFYVGYSFKVPNSSQYYLPVDGIVTDNPEGGWVGVVSDGAVQWMNLASEIGSNCIGCTIVGENFPQNAAKFYDYAGPMYTAPGENFTYAFLLQNKGFTASNVEIEYSVADGAAQTISSDILSMDNGQPVTISYNEYGVIEVPMTCNVEGLAVPLSFKITKVDGEANTAADNTFTTTISCFERSKGFPRVHLIEEGTGTWCKFCPGGIVMMEYVAEKYPDFFARIALHYDDKMQVSSALSVIQSLFDGFPDGWVNRAFNLTGLQSGSETNIKTQIDQYVESYKDVPAAMGFSELTATMVDDVNLKAETKVKTSFDVANNNRYRLAYYLTQNNVGPYNQTNYYSGGLNGTMGGWEKKGSSVSTMYDDVCRYLLGGVNGISNSLPDELKAGEEVSYTAQMTTAAVNAAEFYLTAFIVDTKTGEVVNAKQIKVEKEYSAVNEISGDATPVSKKYYSVSGVEVENPSNGIYIVRTVYSDGTVKTAKEAYK